MSQLEITQTICIHYIDTNEVEDGGGAGGTDEKAGTLLFFNGASLPLAFWDPVVNALKSSYRCIRFDQRNAGNTEFTGTFTLNDIAADAAHILQTLGVNQVVVAGHAWGGRVAQVFARDYAHLVAGLIICGTGGQLPASTDPTTLKTMTQAFKAGDRTTWEDALHDTFCGAGYRSREAQGFAAITDLLWSPGATTTARWDARVTPSASYWGTADVPALLIYGTEDKNGTPANARALLDAMPQARLEFIDATGHFVVREAAGIVSAHIDQFMRQLDH